MTSYLLAAAGSRQAKSRGLRGGSMGPRVTVEAVPPFHAMVEGAGRTLCGLDVEPLYRPGGMFETTNIDMRCHFCRAVVDEDSAAAQNVADADNQR